MSSRVKWAESSNRFCTDPSGTPDRVLAQLRRSCYAGSEILYRVVEEQNRRGLLRKPRGTAPKDLGGPWGYYPERYRRISDYPAKDVSARFF